MKYIEKQGGKRCFTPEAKNQYKKSDPDHKDAILMDLFGCLGFACGKSRWDGVILWTHIDSRRIVVAVKCPLSSCGWVGCPYPSSSGSTFSFVHEQGYEIRVLNEKIFRKTLIGSYHIKPEKDGEHWLSLPEQIRKAWDSSV